ncbi:hypothetical protein [uncultured Croceitalea sp.]|uniref:hypothetical protein n=1 Tax=uncultured Croceitalea sp. TaxID=1798908 RepID=UPI0033060994
MAIIHFGFVPHQPARTYRSAWARIIISIMAQTVGTHIKTESEVLRICPAARTQNVVCNAEKPLLT